MLRVALTGGIATGKSHVLQEFRKRGVPCLDADDLAHGVNRGRDPRDLVLGGNHTCDPALRRPLDRRLIIPGHSTAA